jgi:hypothetical protein
MLSGGLEATRLQDSVFWQGSSLFLSLPVIGGVQNSLKIRIDLISRFHGYFVPLFFGEISRQKIGAGGEPHGP